MPSSLPAADGLPFGLHDLPFGLLLLALFVVAFARGNATYWVGRLAVTGGRRAQRLRRYLDGPAMRRAETFVARWGVLAVPLCFLTVGVQTAVNLSAGVTRMPLRRYLPAVAVGAVLWAILYATIGLAAVAAAIGIAATSPWVLLAVAVAIIAVVVWRGRRSSGTRRDGSRAPTTSTPAEEGTARSGGRLDPRDRETTRARSTETGERPPPQSETGPSDPH